MKTERPTARRVLGMVIGIVIISLGIAIFKQSHLGNDSITALNIRLSELLGISLGVQNICTNLVFLVVEFIWGRKYIGLGTLVNGLGRGLNIKYFYVYNKVWVHHHFFLRHHCGLGRPGRAAAHPAAVGRDRRACHSVWLLAVPDGRPGRCTLRFAGSGPAGSPAQALLRLPRLYRCTLCGHHLPVGRPGRHRHPGLRLRSWTFHPILQRRVL